MHARASPLLSPDCAKYGSFSLLFLFLLSLSLSSFFLSFFLRKHSFELREIFNEFLMKNCAFFIE